MLDLSHILCPWEDCGNGNGGGGQVIQSVTAAMRELQSFGPAGALVEIEKEASTNPGVRLQCELASVQAASSLRLSFLVPQVHMTTKVSPINVISFEPRLAFPDDSPAPMPVSLATMTTLPKIDMTPVAATQTSSGLSWSYLFPVAALAGSGGPPTGRVQYYVEAGVTLNDVMRIFSFNTLTNWGGGLNISLEEVTGIVVQ